MFQIITDEICLKFPSNTSEGQSDLATWGLSCNSSFGRGFELSKIITLNFLTPKYGLGCLKIHVYYIHLQNKSISIIDCPFFSCGESLLKNLLFSLDSR